MAETRTDTEGTAVSTIDEDRRKGWFAAGGIVPLVLATLGVSGTWIGNPTALTPYKMTCAACPITVGMAMHRVDGVRSVEIDFPAKTATVSFDPAVTTPGEIAQASADAGYPAQVFES